jgi:hypothetical protein
MMKLSFFNEYATEPAFSVDMRELSVVGGTMSGPGLASSATYLEAGWSFRGVVYPILAVTGGGCLVLGGKVDPTFVSDPIDHFYFMGPSFSANGVAIAKYVSSHDIWQGVHRPLCYQTLQILMPEVALQTTAERPVIRMNPWDADLTRDFAVAHGHRNC